MPDKGWTPPDHEIKLLLLPDAALQHGGVVAQDLVDAFALRAPPARMRMQFVDAGRTLDRSGWNVRLRRIDGRHDGELTFKRRYRIGDEGVDAAWEAARVEGFVDADNYHRQLEWSREKRTLSVSRDKTFELPGEHGFELPDLGASVATIVQELPGRLKAVQIGGESVVDVLSGRAMLYGPVSGVRWTGTWHERELRIERWDIPTAAGGLTPVVEASIVQVDYFSALETRRALAELLAARNWLESRDFLKTQMILDAFEQQQPTEVAQPAGRTP